MLVGVLTSANSSLLESESSESDIDPESRASSSFVALSSALGVPDGLGVPSVIILLLLLLPILLVLILVLILSPLLSAVGSSGSVSVTFSCGIVIGSFFIRCYFLALKTYLLGISYGVFSS